MNMKKTVDILTWHWNRFRATPNQCSIHKQQKDHASNVQVEIKALWVYLNRRYNLMKISIQSKNLNFYVNYIYRKERKKSTHSTV